MKCYKYSNCKVLPLNLTDEMMFAWDTSPNNNEDDNINMREAYYAMFDATKTETVGEICIELLESVISSYKMYHGGSENIYIKMLQNTINTLKGEG
ncbi:MAG: hypothetical protein ACRC6V_06865 [Bacteroidales bacterium]